MKFKRAFLCVLTLLISLCASQAGTIVRFGTKFGNIDVELFDTDKPITVSNFLRYVHGGLYTNMFMHRVVQNFVIQGGGYYVTTQGGSPSGIDAIATFAPITNEFNVGPFHSNVYGTLAMAKTSDPNSATSQFFFNLSNNSASLDDTNNSGGFTVFGQVIAGTNVLNQLNIGASHTSIKLVDASATVGSPFSELPVLYAANSNSLTFSDLVYINTQMLTPSIQSQPTDKIVVQGQTATFTVGANGGDKLAYSWLFNGQIIKGASKTSYLISKVQSTDAGSYSVIVSNTWGSVTSSVATLTVVPSATLSITTPADNSRVTNFITTLMALAGTTASPVGVAAVWYQLNSNAWAQASSTDSYAHWTVPAASPVPGANVLSAYYVDTTGTHSATQTVRFTCFQNFSLTLTTNGQGSITRNQKGALLAAGAKLSLKAVPANNWLFSNWSGDITTNAASITLPLRTNLALQANFVTNPFIQFGLARTYHGLFCVSNNPQLESSGFFSMSLSAKGAYSGKLVFTGKSLTLSGQISPAMMVSKPITLPSGTAATVAFQLNPVDGRINGTISNSVWSATLTGYPGGLFPTNNAGAYTLLIPGADDSTGQPGGDGFGAITLKTSGLASFKGSLADNTPFTLSASVSRQGLWPVFAPLYSGKGTMFGWLTFTNDSDNDLNGKLTWIKLSQKATYYGTSFTNTPEALGSRYTPSTPAFGFTDGMLSLSEGGLAAALTNSFVSSTAGKLTSDNKSLKLTLTTASGLFQGSIANPVPGATPKSFTFKGALLSKQTNGAGFFLGSGQTGRVRVEPATP